MAGQLASFMSGSQLKIRFSGKTIAYAQGISWRDNMTVVPVGGIGSYSYHTQEPTQYIGDGSFVITQFTSAIFNAIKGDSGNKENFLPENLQSFTPDADGRVEGNSQLDPSFFNPRLMLMGMTFDIDIVDRSISSITGLDASSLPATNSALLNEEVSVYKLQDCRLTNYSFSFTPGQLLQENVSFICLRVFDEDVDPSSLTTGAAT